MDYQQIIQRNIAKITIGIAVVGVTTFTVWYYNSHKTEQEPYIEQVPSSPLSRNISDNNGQIPPDETINDTNTQQLINHPINSATSTQNTSIDHNNDINEPTTKTNNQSNIDSNAHGLSETDTSEQIIISTTIRTNVKPINNKQSKTAEKSCNDSNLQNQQSEQMITESKETENEEQYSEINEMSDGSEKYTVSDYKAKYNSNQPPKIKVTHSDEYTKQEILEIHARNEIIAKQKRKVGRLNKDSFKFVENNDENSTRQRGSSTPLKVVKDDDSWVKLRTGTVSGHAEHPSVMQLNLIKLVTDAKIIGALTPISDQKASSISMKTTRRSRKANHAPQKQ